MENPIQSTLADDGTAVVTALGEIDFANADEVAQGIRDAVEDWSPTAVRIDLRKATFIDSTGLGALIEGYRAASEGASSFAVIKSQRQLPPRTHRHRPGASCSAWATPRWRPPPTPRPAHKQSRQKTQQSERRRPPSGATGVVKDSAPGGSSRIHSMIAGGATTESLRRTRYSPDNVDTSRTT
jgi:anti-sigma B factor antagonist